MTRDDLRSSLLRELTQLEVTERPRLLAQLSTVDGRDPADRADRVVLELDLEQAETRIARLRDRLAVLDRPARPSAGRPVPGTAVVLDFGEGPETCLLDDFPHGETPVITPGSPLGRALADAGAGQTVTYRTPRGEVTVTLVGFDDALGA
jgi:transcription elongation GreA/GreB family factor